MRKTIRSVTCFLHCGNEYLFIHRTKKGTQVDAHKLNGIGGKLESNENFLQAALRETTEETGYICTAADCTLAGVVTLTEGYPDDWMMCFFSIAVPSTTVPLGMHNSEGDLMWLPAQNVLTSGYELVDDLYYLWEAIVAQEGIFFAHSIVNDAEKIEHMELSHLR